MRNALLNTEEIETVSRSEYIALIGHLTLLFEMWLLK